MSRFKDTQGITGLSTKTVTWAENAPFESSEASGDLPSRASFSSSVTKPISKTLALVKNVALVGRIADWWGDSAGPSIQNPSLRPPNLPVSKELPSEEGLEALTISELIGNLDYRNRPRLNPKHPAWEENSDIAGNNYNTPIDPSTSLSEEASRFIRSDTKGQARELRVELELARAKIGWLNRDYKTMVSCSMKALELSEEFEYLAYSAKVCFYVAVGYFGTNDFARGRQFLKHAEKCKGVFREGDMIDWAGKEATLYEKRIGKKRPLPSKHRTDAVRNSAAEHASAASSPTGANIPGRGWQFARRRASMSPNYVGNAQPQGHVSKGSRNSKSRATASPSPNLDSLDDELGKSDEHGEETVDDQVGR